MDFCSRWNLPLWLCQLDIFKLSIEEWLSFLLGTLIIVFFAIDHYKIPTYAKTTIGEFIELAPESLTSAKRYRKGLWIYVSLMLGLYLAFCFFWSKGLNTFLNISGINDPSGDKFSGNQLWPIAAATAVTFIGASGDKNILGRIETALRSIAHQSAYIPDAVVSLSSALNGSFAITVEMAQQVGESSPAVLTQVAECQDGWIQTWIRAKYLFSRLEQLRHEPEFQQLLNHPENVRSFDFLDEERKTLTERVAQRLKAKQGDPDEPLRKKIENFRSAVSVFLASLLWQGCGSEISIQRKLTRLKLLVESTDHFSWNFTVRVLASLAAAAALAYVVWGLFDWEWKEYLTEYSWHLTNAVLVFFMTALFTIKRRERRLSNGTKERAFDAALGSAICCGLPIGIVAAVITFALHGQGLTMFWIMLLTGLCLAVLSSLLFEFVMRLAAQSPPTRGALRRLSGAMPAARADFYSWLSRSVLIAASAAFVMIFVMFWLEQAVISKRLPKEALESAETYLTKLVESYSSKPEDDRNRVDDRFRNVSFDTLLGKVRNAKSSIDKGDVTAAIGDIEGACKAINQKFGEDALLKSCGPNAEVTKPLGDGAWLDLFRDAMLRVDAAVIRLDRFKSYATPVQAMEADWPRALAVSVLWAFLAAVFAASILLYRRSVLWGAINIETLKDCTPSLATTPEWLRTPIDELEDLTPLEAMRYQDLRASLSDQLRANKRRPATDLPVAA
jgi:hypothetical protein